MQWGAIVIMLARKSISLYSWSYHGVAEAGAESALGAIRAKAGANFIILLVLYTPQFWPPIIGVWNPSVDSFPSR